MTCGSYDYPAKLIRGLWNMGGKGRTVKPPNGIPKKANSKDASAKGQNHAKKNTSD